MTKRIQDLPREEILVAVRRMTRAGLSGYKIAQELGVHVATVYRMRRELDTPGMFVHHPWTDDELRRATQLFSDGCSLAEVSRTLRRPISSVRIRFPGEGWTVEQTNEFNRHNPGRTQPHDYSYTRDHASSQLEQGPGLEGPGSLGPADR